MLKSVIAGDASQKPQQQTQYKPYPAIAKRDNNYYYGAQSSHSCTEACIQDTGEDPYFVEAQSEHSKARKAQAKSDPELLEKRRPL